MFIVLNCEVMSGLKKNIPQVLILAWFFTLAMTVCPYLCEARAYQEQKAHSCCPKDQTEQKSEDCGEHDQLGSAPAVNTKATCDSLPAPQLVASAFAGRIYYSNGIKMLDAWADPPPKLPLYLIKVSLLF